ncbi:hypothetical protein SAMN05421755_10543 [Nitrosomonas sp. Nm33]|nr:hypothetical protein SAMN05421755_10543 [Nitrosomonas sp. Nm33]
MFYPKPVIRFSSLSLGCRGIPANIEIRRTAVDYSRPALSQFEPVPFLRSGFGSEKIESGNTINIKEFECAMQNPSARFENILP